jgi:steroid delta-isomerase-like uncharacterized protein
MAQDLKQIHRRMLEDVWGAGKLETIELVCDESYVAHDPLTGDADIEALEDSVRMYRAAFPDLTPTILSTIAEGDTVCTRWRMDGTHENPILGIPASGKHLSVDGITVTRFRGDKLAESFVQWNTLSFLQQLGVVPGLDALVRSRGEEAEAQPHA